MMKRILIIVFLLVLNFTLKAQIPQEPNTYGYNFKRVGADSLLWIPKDTLQVPSWGVGKTHIARKGTTLYYWDGTKWSAISGSGGTYTAGNGLTLSGSQFKWGGTLTDDTTLINQASKRLRFYGNETMFDSLRLTSAGESDYMITHRKINFASGPVVNFTPKDNNKVIAFDIMPRGAPSEVSGQGYAWLDVCDRDVSSTLGSGVVAARVGITSTAAQFGSKNFDGASAKNVEIVVDTDKRITLSTTNTATFNIGKITQSQSLSGDFVGYYLMNTNNTVAESNPIFFIGQDIASNRFGYLRWNNNASAVSVRAANSIELVGGGGATGGVAIRADALGAPIRFTNNTGSLGEVMRIQYGNVGIGTTTTSAKLHTVGTVRHASLGTASTDTTTYKPLGIDTNGNLIPMSNWYGGGGGGTPGGSTKQFQYNNAGAFAGSGMLTQETDQILITGNSAASTPPFEVNAHEDLTAEIINVKQSGSKKFSFHSNGSIELAETTDPTAAATGYNRLYAQSGKLYTHNDDGRVAQVVQTLQLTFGAGSGADSDTTAFTTSAIYGSFYNDADTIVVTSMRSVLQGTSPDVTYKVWYNDSLNVEAGATALVTAGSQVTNTTTGTNVTSFDVTKIPPGVWVWVKTSTVATKPKYFSLTVNGYRK